MKFPNWFKISWWIVLLLFTGSIMFKRNDSISANGGVPADVFVFLVFVSLTLVPLCAEVEFFGLKFKKELYELKDNVNLRIGELKSAIRNS